MVGYWYRQQGLQPGAKIRRDFRSFMTIIKCFAVDLKHSGAKIVLE
jgi:hypothetical protein